MDGACGGVLRRRTRVDSRMPAGRAATRDVVPRAAWRGGQRARPTRTNVPAPTGEG